MCWVSVENQSTLSFYCCCSVRPTHTSFFIGHNFSIKLNQSKISFDFKWLWNTHTHALNIPFITTKFRESQSMALKIKCDKYCNFIVFCEVKIYYKFIDVRWLFFLRHFRFVPPIRSAASLCSISDLKHIFCISSFHFFCCWYNCSFNDALLRKCKTIAVCERVCV